MKKLLLTTAVAAITLSPLTSYAQFGGFGKLFGSTKSNPGSVLPEWWNEYEYNPPSLDGAMHIRVGSAGAASERYTAGGRRNCDWAYLYAAKAGTTLDPREKEECALLEFHIKKGVDGDTRNLADGFVRQDILAEMYKKIDARIEQFRAPRFFYFRAVALKVEPYDFQWRHFPLQYNWTSTTTQTAEYVLRGRGFTDSTGWMKLALPVDDATAREVEAARTNTNGAFIRVPSNKIVFEVVSAKPGAKGTRVREMEVRFAEVTVPVTNANGQTQIFTIQNQQK